MTSLNHSPGGCIVVMGIKVRRFDPLPYEISLEDLVPKDGFYRRLEAALDLSFVRDLVRPLYAKGGRPSVDPVVFFRLQLVMFFEGIRSERELMRGDLAKNLGLCRVLGESGSKRTETSE